MLLVLAGCPTSAKPSQCTTDPDCGGLVCARNGECLSANQIWMVKVTWTIRGMPASATTCATTPSFYLQFDGQTTNDTFGYTPVPCDAGIFSIDKIPRRFFQVELGVDQRFTDIALIDAMGAAKFDIYP